LLFFDLEQDLSQRLGINAVITDQASGRGKDRVSRQFSGRIKWLTEAYQEDICYL
jgi:hypothetical protein